MNCHSSFLRKQKEVHMLLNEAKVAPAKNRHMAEPAPKTKAPVGGGVFLGIVLSGGVCM